VAQLAQEPLQTYVKANAIANTATKKTLKPLTAAKVKRAATRKPMRAKPATIAKTAKAPVVNARGAELDVQAKEPRATRAPAVSKEELRNQIEKLTAANVTMKVKNRQTAEALRATAARIAVLELQIGQTQRKVVIEDKAPEKDNSPRNRRTPNTVA
jgi:hypothetical protein